MKLLVLLVIGLCYVAGAPWESWDGIMRPQECEPGTVFPDDCNTCRCGPDGRVSHCTMVACRRSITTRVCEPGNTWTEGCNDCVCLSDGSFSCTDNPCTMDEVRL